MKTQKNMYPSLDTPAVLIDLDKLESNIAEMSRNAYEAGIVLRPHVKVHQCAEIALMQIKAGAIGIDVGSLGQAEAMAEAGLSDILISHPGYYGGKKNKRLTKLLKHDGLKLTLMVDMLEQARDIASAAKNANRSLPVFIKVDTNARLGGVSRMGILPGKPLLTFAKELQKYEELVITGIYAHEMGSDSSENGNNKTALETALLMSEMATLLRNSGIGIEHVSVGASNTFRATCRYFKEGIISGITEIDPGNCVIGDIGYSKKLANLVESAAATVLTTVISTSHDDKAMIDAGYKTFGADYNIGYVNVPGFYWNNMPSFGSVKGNRDLWCGRLSAEVGAIYYQAETGLAYGDRIEIVPNNATLVINLHDSLYGVRNGDVERMFHVNGRGRSS